MGYKDFVIFMLCFVAGAAVLGVIVYYIIRFIGRARTSTEISDYMRFNRDLDAKLEKLDFKRTLLLNDNFAIDEEQGKFYCSFPYGKGLEYVILPISAITEYKLEKAAAFTTGYIFTFAFVELEPPRKVSRQVHVINDEIKDRLVASLEKYGAMQAEV